VTFKEVAELKEAEENLNTRKSTINWVRVEPTTILATKLEMVTCQILVSPERNGAGRKLISKQ